MPLTVLSVAYPLAPVGRDTAGGAEQVLASLDRGLAAAGHRSIVVAREDSTVASELVPVPAVRGPLDERAKAWAQEAVRAAIRGALAREPVDLVHLHGVDFPAYLPPPGPAVLVTLHLPPDFYPPQALRPARPDTWLVPVSRHQHGRCPPHPRLLAPIENGVPVEAFRPRARKLGFALSLGRICPEKGQHLAIEAARLADMPLVLAGEVYPYEAHERYFREEIRPRLDARRRFVGPAGFARKRRLLAAARCLLVTSLVHETSSLVAREALACGTPVVALDRGALREAVDHGETGFLVGDFAGMARAMREAGSLDARRCRAAAERRFGERAMVQRYLAVYRAVLDARRAGAA